MGETFNIISFLKSAVKTGASDEHLIVGHSPFIRKNGFIKATNVQSLTKNDIDNAILEISPSSVKETVLTMQDLDFMFEIKGVSRFRVNYNRQLGLPSLVIRNISYGIPSPEELHLPGILTNLMDYSNGIILVTGPTGSGKSTTLASLVNYININHSKHIVTIEDPVEYIFQCSKSIVSQRQVGVDTESFASGIKYALRQDPDVIFIGEIRDEETMAAALKASETGHLVLTTLHTIDAVQTISRIVNMFEETKRDLVRKQLAETLRASIAQKLVYSNELNERYPACEVLVSTSTVKSYIEKNNLEEIYDLINDNNIDDMISMNSSLSKLVEQGRISKEEALEASNDSNALDKVFKGVFQGSKNYYE
ncbi:MAG: PilT/PilU family type 4a pilus ATPase [bacterium]|nr:PilT/PilU family type 4a pilus ATPase [bacterium]